MVINVAKSAGFCFGVRRAIDIACGVAAGKNKVYMLGDIVHNELVVDKICKAGIRKIRNLTKGKNKSLLICAHGVPFKVIEKASKLGYKIIDATCPMVKEIHRIAKDCEREGYRIIVIGDKKHDEVQGIVGQLKSKAIVSDGKNPISIKKIKKAAVVVQSTQDYQKVNDIVGALRKKVSDLKFFNTICRPTRLKQEEVKKMAPDNDVMVVIGSKTSANTKRLYEISKSLNPNTYWIQSQEDVKPGWFEKIKSAGITAGASTPDSTTKEVIEHIEKITLLGGQNEKI